MEPYRINCEYQSGFSFSCAEAISDNFPFTIKRTQKGMLNIQTIKEETIFLINYFLDENVVHVLYTQNLFHNLRTVSRRT